MTKQERKKCMSKIRTEKYSTKKGDRYRVKFTYLDEYGFKQTYSKRGFTSKKKAEAYGLEKYVEIENNGGQTKECSKTLCDCFNEYMELSKDKYANNSIISYRNIFQAHVQNTKIANIPISRLNYLLLQQHFNTLSHLGKSLVNRIKIIFNKAFKHALKCQYVKENPMPLVEMKYTKSSKEKTVLTQSDLENLITVVYESNRNSFNKNAYAIAIYIGFYTGLRLTEILALEKSDFDFENDTVTVTKKLEDQGLKKKEMYITTDMKTASSKATLPIPKALKERLLDWFEMNPYDLVCCKQEGDIIHPNTIRKVISFSSKKIGLEVSPHNLRHSYITHIIASGVDPKTAMTLARHSNVSTTLQVYTHTDDERKKEAIHRAFEQNCPKNAPKSNFMN